jgi:glycerol-3-phosphate acyltransferase PlsX
VKIALDAMGGDLAPAAPVEGALQFLSDFGGNEVVLVGDERQLREALGGRTARGLTLLHASEVVEMTDHAVESIRKKKDSSIRRCFELLKHGEVSAVVSAGHSGAAMAAALFVVGRVRGIDRPAIAALFPALGGGRCLLLDAGATVECRPLHLVQFALMGELYARNALKIPSPRIGILSNGEEDTKGTKVTREALAILRKSDLRLVGYVEGKDLFSGFTDVVVTDGFTGNVVLKTSEGTAMGMAALIRSAIERSGLSERLGALLLKPTLAGLRKVVDYSEYGGAPLLGIDGVGIIAHGRSSPKAMRNALKTALSAAAKQMSDELRQRVEQAQSWLPRRHGMEKEAAAPAISG